ncbi:MAG: hypothetical protein AAGJ52_01785 [Pseudomonadota bacterium]
MGDYELVIRGVEDGVVLAPVSFAFSVQPRLLDVPVAGAVPLFPLLLFFGCLALVRGRI